jgi:3-oxoacyl-[acyl-carrier protein] reductase
LRRALVTGSSRGIGRAIALRLARAGFAVTLHCRERIGEAERVAAEIRDLGGQVSILRFDVRERAAVRRALDSDIGAHGAYYGIVLNAGIARDNAFPALSDEDWDHVIDTSLDGFFNVLQPLVMPMVRAKQGGRVVVLSSVSGIVGNRGQVNYSAAKAGLIGAAKALAVELASRNITVNCVAPGPIATEMIAGAPLEEMLKAVPMRRAGTPEEVAATVAFLMSDEAGYVTRQVIGVNGGIV